jgi:hypothetical protein
VAGLAENLRDRGAPPRFVRRALDAYGWGDEQELVPFIAAQDVYYEMWRLYIAQRRSMNS